MTSTKHGWAGRRSLSHLRARDGEKSPDPTWLALPGGAGCLGTDGLGSRRCSALSFGSRLFCCQTERGLAVAAVISCRWEDQLGLAAC